MKIYLVRHGETTGDVEDRIGGSYDDHLTEKGHQQLAETAKKLIGKDIEIIFSSPLIRAKESSTIIAKEISVPVEIIDGLRERHYGVITGLTKQEAKQKYPEAIERHNDLNYVHPEGESYGDFYNRVINAFKPVAEKNHKTIAILGHGGSLKCILKELSQSLPDKIDDGGIIEVNIG